MREELAGDLLLMLILQAAMQVIKLYVLVETQFQTQMLTMVIMICFTIVFLLYTRSNNQELSIMPKEFNIKYKLATLLVLIAFFFNPGNFVDGYKAILLLIYGSVVTPIYEEIIFRGFMWNRFNTMTHENITYVLTSLLFAIWQIGYMFMNIVDGNYIAVISKAVIGLGYGLVTGYLRLKTDNVYSTILLHGFLNMFLG